MFFGNSNDQVMVLKIKILNDWTPHIFLGVITKEAKAACIIYLSRHVIQDYGAINNIFNLIRRYYNIDMVLL